MHFLTLFFFLIAGIFAPIVVGAASDDAESVIAECQKRTGMGRESCIGFIKKYMNVERCQQYAKLSASECEKKLEEIRNSPEFQDKPKGSTAPQSPQPVIAPQAPVPVGAPRTLREQVLAVKRDREERLELIQRETVKVVAFLKERGGEIARLEAALQVFEQKKQATLAAYDQYVRFAELEPSKRPPLSEPRQIVGSLLRETTEHYRTIILPELRRLISQITP